MTRSVLISGGGIAGPSLAYWLGTSGYAVTVVERAPGLRTSGAAPVDFRGDQLALLERMGVLDDIRGSQTGMGDQTVIDASGRRLSTFPSVLFSGDVEIERGDLARILYNRSAGAAEYVFGDHVTGMTQDADGVDVTFAHGAPRRFDLVVGADGLHSAVRRLAFGEEPQFRYDLGLCVAGFDVPNTFGLDHGGLIYNEPGRLVMVASGRDRARAAVCLMFTASPPDCDWRDTDGQKQIVAEHFADVGWQAPALLAALRDAPELYFDTISQIRLGHRPRRERHRPRHARRVHARRGTSAGRRRPRGGLRAFRADHAPAGDEVPEDRGRRGPLPHPGDRAQDPQPQPDVPHPVIQRDDRAVRLAGEADRQHRIPAGLPAQWPARPGPGRPAVPR